MAQLGYRLSPGFLGACVARWAVVVVGYCTGAGSLLYTVQVHIVYCTGAYSLLYRCRLLTVQVQVVYCTGADSLLYRCR